MDRRANCLEDRTGFTAGLATNNPEDATKTIIDYYYHNAPINNKTFEGFKKSLQEGEFFLKKFAY